MKILDLGCADRKYKSKNPSDEVIGVDFYEAYSYVQLAHPDKNVDVVHNLDVVPYPFEDNEFDLVVASHILEHLKYPEKCIKEIHRILKENGKLIVKVPHYSSATAVSFGRLGHLHYFNLAAFKTEYFTKYFKVDKTKLNYLVFRDTWYKKLINTVFSFFANLSPRFCERFWCYWFGGFSEIEVEMVRI